MNVKKGEIVLVFGVFLVIGIFIFFKHSDSQITGSAIAILPDLTDITRNESALINETSIINGSSDLIIEPNSRELTPVQEEIKLLPVEQNILSVQETIGIQGAASTTSCGTVTTNLSLNSAVSSGGSCFNISANNITIDCKGFRITYGSTGTGGYGINNSEGYDNLIIKNCVIIEGSVLGNGQFAIYLNTTVNTTIENNTINTSGTSAYGIYLTNSNVTTLYLNTITTNGSNGYGINLAGTNGSKVFYNNITTSGSQGYALYLNNFSGNNTFTTNSLSSGTAFEILDETGDNAVNYLIYNNTFGEIRWLDNGTGGFPRNLTLNGTIGPGTNVFFDYNLIAFNTSAFSSSRINSTANITFYQISLGTATQMLKIHDFSTSNPDVRSTGSNCNATSCPITSYSNVTGLLLANTTSLGSFTANGTFGCNHNVTRDFYMDRNVSAAFVTGSCYNISNVNLTFDCRGYSITGNATGSAIGHNVSRFLWDVTIAHCFISNFTRGINSDTNNWSIIHNTIFNISSTGIFMNRVGKIINNTVYHTAIGIDYSGAGVGFDSVAVGNNTLYDNQQGIYGGNRNNLYQNNNLSHNFIGIAVPPSGGTKGGNSLENNFFYNNTIGYIFGANNYYNSTFSSDRFIMNGNATYINSTQSPVEDLIFKNSYFANNTVDINVIAFSTFNLTIINSSTINKSKIVVPANGYVYFKTIVDVNVTDTSQNALGNVTVTAISSTGEINTFNETNSNGISRLLVTELFRTANINYYLTPTTFRINKNNYTYNTSSSLRLFNLTYLLVNLSLTPITCGSTIYSNFDFGNNYICNGNGLIVVTDGVRIKGNGFNISSQNTGTGLTLNESDIINISNLRVSNFRIGVHISNSNNSNLTDIDSVNNVRGVVFNNSHNNFIYDSILENNSEYSIYGVGNRTTNNSLVNISIDIVNISVDSNTVIFYRWYVIVNATFNGANSLQSATVNGYRNSTGSLDDSSITGVNGSATLKLAQFMINSSGRNYFTPHNITLVFNYLGINITNETAVNISSTNNTAINLSITLGCITPTNNINIAGHTTFCPGTYQVQTINITSNSVNLTCVQTILKNSLPLGTPSRIIYIFQVNHVKVSGCTLEDGYIGIESQAAKNLTLQNLTIKNSNLWGILLLGRFDSVLIDNVTIVGGSNPTDAGILLSASTNITIQRSNFTGNLPYGIRLNQANNITIRNNSFDSVSTAIWFDTASGYSSNNSFYHNQFVSVTTYNYLYTTTSGLQDSFNTTVSDLTQGNQYSDYCDKGKDTNGDGYADTNSTPNAADWPYNATVAGTKITEDGGHVIDYGPKIVACASSTVFLGSSESGGSSPAAVSAPAASAPADAGGAQEHPPPPPPLLPAETYSASEAAEFLERQVTTQDLNEKNIKVTFILENTGTKRMLLFPEIFQKIGDPFFIVTRKTLGFEGSFFTKLSALSYSRDPVAGRLLKATIVNPEQIILNPGEKIEKTIEIDDGLPIPREIKIQFTTLGETVFEEDVTVKQKAFSGTALDIDKEHQYLDIYAVIVPEELTTELEQYYAGNPTGAAIAQKRNFVGFAQQIMQQLTPDTKQNQYQLELGLYEPGSSEAFFTDLYGPYDLKENQIFIFAQQLKYNPKIYNGNYLLKTKIYRSGSLLVQNQFEVELGTEKRGMLWQWIAVQCALVLVGGMMYFTFRSSRKRLTIKKDL